MLGTNQCTILEQFLRNKLHRVHWSFFKNNCAMLFEREIIFLWIFLLQVKPTNVFILAITKSSCHGYVSNTLNFIFVNHFSFDGIESIFTSGGMFVSSSMKAWHMAAFILKRTLTMFWLALWIFLFFSFKYSKHSFKVRPWIVIRLSSISMCNVHVIHGLVCGFHHRLVVLVSCFNY